MFGGELREGLRLADESVDSLVRHEREADFSFPTLPYALGIGLTVEHVPAAAHGVEMTPSTAWDAAAICCIAGIMKAERRVTVRIEVLLMVSPLIYTKTAEQNALNGSFSAMLVIR